jgi:lipopolysaccharide/colanic/teichoic acid biosynthesis glycosyltransferase
MTVAGWVRGHPAQVTPAHRAPSVLGLGVKRALDLVGATLLLLVLWPVVLVAGLAVRATSPGPMLFRQERVGRGGRTFTMLKLRTMRTDTSDALHRAYVARLLSGQALAVDGLYKLQGDARVTTVGGFLRRTSVDEIPQLWNVLRGHMSLVGPRPSLPWEVDLFPPWARTRFDVRPGLTGLWQVSGRSRLSMLDGLALDVRYVERRSLLLDLGILVRTVGAVCGRGAR